MTRGKRILSPLSRRHDGHSHEGSYGDPEEKRETEVVSDQVHECSPNVDLTNVGFAQAFPVSQAAGA